MTTTNQAFDERVSALMDEVEQIETAWGTDPATMPKGQAERRERLLQGVQNAVREQEAAEVTRAARELRAAKVEQVRQAAMDPRNVEIVGHGPSGEHAHVSRNKVNPWGGLNDRIGTTDSPTGLRTRAHDAVEAVRGIPQDGREMLANLLDDPRETNAAELVIAATDPHYRSAFDKVMRNPTTGHLMWTAEEQVAYQRTESSRAALSLTGANGGYLVPFTLDPTIILTNASAANPFRAISRHATTTTNSWNGVASSGVTAQWLAEGAVAADATPTFSQLPITPAKAAAFLFGSYEVLDDSDFTNQLSSLIMDAKNNLESAAFATGTGTGQPKGIVTAATTTVTTASVNTYAIADIYALQQALPPRARYGKSLAVVGSVNVINKTRQFDTAGGASYWTNLGQGMPPTVLDMRVAEASGMVTTTTTGSKILVAGDFDKYQIVDRIGMTVVYDPMLKDQATARPTGQAGWFAYWRVGADALDPTCFRTLIVQ